MMGISIISGLLVCGFVYVIRSSFAQPGEEDGSMY
ncbi:hypothetical protein JOC58_001612 [Paenibacillus hunanensis]|uniref:Uncharacterized protein n=1 Tax=Paenibacillus hunanensis TaxID=539262 RepID=A0ABU1IWS9_9BACL|nr:hypothetical protein [Paenibacillus hunanensis]